MWVEVLALAGVIQPTEQTPLAHELWDYLFPQFKGNYFANWGTIVDDMSTIRTYLQTKFGRTITMNPVYPTVDSINAAFQPGFSVQLAVRLDMLRPELGLGPDGHWLLGRSDTGQFVHYLDSCAAIDFSPGQDPTAGFANACLNLVGAGNVCGWSVRVN